MADVSLYDRASITPEQLIEVARLVGERWPGCTLHKNDVTKNLTVKVDGVSVGMLNLLDATVDDFGDGDDSAAFIAGATEAGEGEWG